jgi:predicted AAA+ superfamily ATPase
MLQRRLLTDLKRELRENAAVVLLGPRQVGKTTLALMATRERNAVYLDLESDTDRARLENPELYLSDLQGRLVVLDEIHRSPGLFPILRGMIDKARRNGRRTGQYLLLGSASLPLLRQSGETLAGRVSYLELAPFDLSELSKPLAARLWLRGGFPESLLARNAMTSMRWRRNFIRSYLERDIPLFGSRIAATTLQRFWTMLAHHQGGLLNTARFAGNLGVDGKTAAGYLDLMVDLLLVRRLPPWHSNLGKRLIKSPKVYVRDSGIVHALLGVPDLDSLLSHPVVGASWEGYVIENLLANAPQEVRGYFYRTSSGAEIDLVLHRPDGKLWAVEIKRSTAPTLERGFHSACDDLKPARKFVVYPGTERYRLAKDIEVISLSAMVSELSAN